ncbi:ECF RNA polymerase sigma-E factor [Planctomycetes bacterium Poly30]|uniref:ECF RNA polymerase sigma-E factor n=1 Tax=Saltatorellus ferox TaxID=2528018 RepID=A0A518EKI3_9BACT|nr:ECF RNA polymerase sigma-E factor [Planctomycetes bacterium Poly30]
MSQESDEITDPLEQSFDGRPPLSGIMPVAKRAQEGDPDALNQLFQYFQEPLRRIVRMRLGKQLRQASQMDSMDFVQNTFVKAHDKFGGFELRHESGIIAWLARIAERQISDAYTHVNASKRDHSRLARLDDLLGFSEQGFDPASDETLPEGKAWREEIRSIVDECVGQLSDDYREMILLRDYAQADWVTIVEVTGLPTTGAAQTKHIRARAALSVKLARRFPDGF